MEDSFRDRDVVSFRRPHFTGCDDRRTWLICLLCSVLSVLVLAASEVYQHSGVAGYCVVSPNPIDLKTIGEGIHQAKFIIRNDSRQKATIESLNSSCTCTTVVVAATSILPGGQTTGIADWEVTGQSGEVASGFVVNYSLEGDTTQHRCPVNLTAQVEPWWTTSPREITFISGAPASDISARIKIIPVRERNVTVMAAECSSNSFSVRVLSESNEIEVTMLDSKLKRGSLSEIDILTDSSLRAVDRVPVVVR